ncbi:MAG: hypothetical protein BJBARM5_0959 [Candidatus Parvarchaeum acidophilus ARMAN-5]|uniref:Uncharacterized protein n=1 Tax=Candidatus Parvarchaeum acidophilus ARMAN-5 TaxID=662762 RepID=D6GWT2_PARA5|nr:MAG: hypothetical protein BJBARM5_0959 [Candidatus Parvarchaeum acidophilus ARMAN-5]
MVNRDFRKSCEMIGGDYNLDDRACIIKDNPRSQAVLQDMINESLHAPKEYNLRDINSRRDTNIDSFNTYDEVFDKDGTIAIRRSNNYIYAPNSVFNLGKVNR